MEGGQGPGCWPQPPISGAGVGWPEVSKHFPTHLIQPFWMGTCPDEKEVKGRCGCAERQTRMQKQPLSGSLWLRACKTALHSQQPAVLCVLQGFTVYMCKLRDRILKAHCVHSCPSIVRIRSPNMTQAVWSQCSGLNQGSHRMVEHRALPWDLRDHDVHIVGCVITMQYLCWGEGEV